MQNILLLDLIVAFILSAAVCSAAYLFEKSKVVPSFWLKFLTYFGILVILIFATQLASVLFIGTWSA